MDPSTKLRALDPRAQAFKQLPVAPGFSEELDTFKLFDKWIQFGGTGWAASYMIQGTLNGNDWVDVYADPVTEPNMYEIKPMFLRMRIRCVSYTSGAPTALLGGRLTI